MRKYGAVLLALPFLLGCRGRPSSRTLSGPPPDTLTTSTGMPTPTSTVARWSGDAGDVVQRVVSKANIHDNSAVHLSEGELTKEAQTEVRAGFDSVPVVLLGTVVDTDVVGCEVPAHGDVGGLRVEANTIHVDAILKGSVAADLVYVDTAREASRVESYVFLYRASFQKGHQYFFFLGPMDLPKDCGRTVYGRFMSAPVKEATN